MNSVTDSETKTKEVSDFLQWVSAQNGDLADAEFCDHLANVVTYGRERANEIRRERTEEVIDNVLQSVFGANGSEGDLEMITWEADDDYEKGSLMDILKNNSPSISD